MTDSPALIDTGPFHLEPDRPGFESLGQENGFRFWWASELATILGYESINNFRKAVERAMTALTSLNIPIFENIIQEPRDVDGKRISDYKLSRFACYLVAMNGDPKKPMVAKAQAYFIAWGEACRLCLEQAESVERVADRAEISDRERSLAGTAKLAGVSEYALFQNAGYRGLYNMNLRDVRIRKGVPHGRSPLDFMGKTELAANMFRITQTDEKIRSDRIRGQPALERTAEEVGRKVRHTMLQISGKRPEDLPPAEDIRSVHKRLKVSNRGIRAIDRKKGKPISRS